MASGHEISANLKSESPPSTHEHDGGFEEKPYTEDVTKVSITYSVFNLAKDSSLKHCVFYLYNFLAVVCAQRSFSTCRIYCLPIARGKGRLTWTVQYNIREQIEIQKDCVV